MKSYHDLRNALQHIQKEIKKHTSQKVARNRFHLKVSIEVVKWLAFQGQKQPVSASSGSKLLVSGVERLWSVVSSVPRAMPARATRLSASLGAATNEVQVACEGSHVVSNEPVSPSLSGGMCSSATGGARDVGLATPASTIAPISCTSTREVTENEGSEAPANPLVIVEPQAGSNVHPMVTQSSP
ncbi:hypothetical protein V6N12_065334 [Hibiscus sabdariffa]|uniref:Uncharacterized protein n=1 Tax=Hibiscus sabdariffa TaxID=183260 RepID=A0ABR2G9C8_9ROSI